MPEVGAHRDPLLDRLLSFASELRSTLGTPANRRGGANDRGAQCVDDGRGFTNGDDRGRGLRNMEQGARSLGGKVTVNTDSGDTGTVVEWRVPVGR